MYFWVLLRIYIFKRRSFREKNEANKIRKPHKMKNPKCYSVHLYALDTLSYFTFFISKAKFESFF